MLLNASIFLKKKKKMDFLGKISKQYQCNVHNFKRKTLLTTITVKLFDSMSNVINISIDTALD